MIIIFTRSLSPLPGKRVFAGMTANQVINNKDRN